MQNKFNAEIKKYLLIAQFMTENITDCPVFDIIYYIIKVDPVIIYSTQTTVVLGETHTMILIGTELYGCGNNRSGQLCLGHNFFENSLVRIPISNVMRVWCGYMTTLVLTAEGYFTNVNHLFLDENTGPFFDNKLHRTTDEHIIKIITTACKNNISDPLKIINTPFGFIFIDLPEELSIEDIISVVDNNDVIISITKIGLFGIGKNNCGQLGLGDNIDRVTFRKIHIP